MLLALGAAALAAERAAAALAWGGGGERSARCLVRLCLDRRGETDGIGSYYYLTKRRAIRLEQQGGSREMDGGLGRIERPARAALAL